MTRYSLVKGQKVAYTAEQEAARDAEEAAWAAGQADRDLEELREERNLKLSETDWEIVKHKELGTNIPTALKTYRQALRDITNTYSSLDDVVWPEKP